MFEVHDRPLEELDVHQYLEDPEAGGVVIFEGRVRNRNQERRVSALEYEVYEELARRETENILEEAGARFETRRCVCLQRSGKLAIGEISTWIGVAAVHRGAAFKACRYIIDEFKDRVPVWKKEYYTDGSHRWINSPQAHTESEGDT